MSESNCFYQKLFFWINLIASERKTYRDREKESITIDCLVFNQQFMYSVVYRYFVIHTKQHDINFDWSILSQYKSLIYYLLVRSIHDCIVLCMHTCKHTQTCRQSTWHSPTDVIRRQWRQHNLSAPCAILACQKQTYFLLFLFHSTFPIVSFRCVAASSSFSSSCFTVNVYLYAV